MNYQIDMDSIAAIYGTAISFYLDQRIEALLPSKSASCCLRCSRNWRGAGERHKMFPLAETKLPFLDICWLFLEVDSKNGVSYALARMRNRRPDIGFHFADGTPQRRPSTARTSPSAPASDFGPTRIEHGQE
jgi:hypothetical protein